MDIFTGVSLIVWPLFLYFSYILFRVSGLDVRTTSLSNLGSKSNVGILFNIALCLVAIIEFAFLSRFIGVSHVVPATVIWLFMFTSLCGFITGVYPEKHFFDLHRMFSVLGMISAVVGWTTFGIFTMQYSIGLFAVILVWAILCASLFIYNFDLKRGVLPALYESLIFCGAFMTNILLLYISNNLR